MVVVGFHMSLHPGRSGNPGHNRNPDQRSASRGLATTRGSTARIRIRPSPTAAASYERLRDVVLDVKLRFGSRRMLLRDVLALSAGVVVELDNNLNSPVDLLLDGRLVAQGEVVVVDGNYGLRVTHVLDSLPPS